MTAIRIVHTADNHLGMKFSSNKYNPTVRERLVQERFDSLRRTVALANEKEAHYLVIAGDLFDSVDVPQKTAAEAANILNDFLGRGVLVLPGNHDFYLPGGSKLWEVFQKNLRDNLLHFLCEQTPFEDEVGERKVFFYPGPCGSKHSDKNAIDWVKDVVKDPAHLHVGIAHGSVVGESPIMGEVDCYFPMTPQELRESGADFWLLGHIHVQHPRVPSQALFYYSSTPTPDGFDRASTNDKTGQDGYVWYLEVDDEKRINAESHCTGGLRFLDLTREIASLDDFQRLKKELTAGAPADTLLRLNLGGSLRSEEQSELHHAVEAMKEEFALLIAANNVKNRITQDDIDKEFVPQSLPHRMLTALQQDEDALQLCFELLQKSQKD